MKHARAPRRGVTALLLLGLFVSACKSKPVEVRVTPLKIQLFGKDRRASVKADILDKKGNPVPDQNVTWESTNPKVASVEPSGIIKTVGPGRAQIVAKLGPLSGAATIEVVDVSAMTLIPGRATLVGPAGTTFTLLADCRDAKGQPVTVKPKWLSSDPKVVQVTDTGLVASVAEGKAIVTATLGTDFSAGSELRVLFKDIASFEIAPLTLILKTGDTQRINPGLKDTSGTIVEDPALVWTTSDPKVASVMNGLVRAEGPGTATITVAAGTRSRSATVLVN
ncbi:MAG: Ig-like domain-containing protein [Thermoanaerobaculia bacterium]